MTEAIDARRRRLFGTMAMTLACAEFDMLGTARAQPGNGLRTIKQVDAGVLNIGYVVLGPAGGPAVILLNGWSYDIHSYAEAAPLLAARGFRVIVPYLRGYGSTRTGSSRAHATICRRKRRRPSWLRWPMWRRDAGQGHIRRHSTVPWSALRAFNERSVP